MLNLKNLKIISGGQSGADRAALDFAMEHGFVCGGWCPAGRMAEDGTIPEKYPLKETGSSDPSERTIMNVNDSDGSLIVYRRELDEGTRHTIQFAKEVRKPIYIIKQDDTINREEFLIWMDVNNIKVLNVAGPRESNDRGVYGFTFDVLNRLLS